MVKNLSQLKKILRKGTCFEIIAHCCPGYVGQKRKVTVANTQGFYSIVPEEPGSVPLLLQLLLLDFVVDLLKLASLNTPDALSNSFSMLGALILGDFAVQARWLVPEVLVYI